MIKHTLSILATAAIISSTYAQEIPANQVPSIVLNAFKKDFSEARDVEWEKMGDQYQVEFETGWSTDHEVWFAANGTMTRHEEEISKKALPKAVVNALSAEFKGFAIDDLKRITTPENVTYQVEADGRSQDWKVTLDQSGKIITKLAD